MCEDVNASLMRWQAVFFSVMEQCIPKIVLRPRKKFPMANQATDPGHQEEESPLLKELNKLVSELTMKSTRGFVTNSLNMLRESKQEYLKGLKFLNKKTVLEGCEIYKSAENIYRSCSSTPGIRM